MTGKLFITVFLALAALFLFRGECTAATASISGTVTAEDTGDGLSEIRVRAMPGDFRAITDEDGSFTISGLSRGMIYWLSFFKEGIPYVNEHSSVEVEIPSDRLVVYVNHPMKLGASVSGTVYGEDGVTPLSGAAVAVSALNQPDWVESYRTSSTDDVGKYFIQGIPESAECIVGAAVYGHAWMEKTVKVAKGVTTGGVDFIISWDDITGIKGTVISKSDNRPLLNARVVLIDGKGKTAGIALANDKGEYSIVGAEPGVYSAIVTLQTAYVSSEDIKIEPNKATTVDFLIDLPEIEGRKNK